MAKMLESSAGPRLQKFRRELTIELYLRHGSFWNCVDWIRRNRGIAADVRLPPALDPGGVHVPLDAVPKNRSWSPTRMQRAREWMALLQSLHDQIIQDEFQVETIESSSLEFWMGFLSACVLYDPPGDKLLEFADHGVAAYGDFLNPLNPWSDADDSLQMFVAPIKFMVDADTLLMIQQDSFRSLLDDLHNRLLPKGINLWELVDHIDYWGTEQAREEIRRTGSISIETRDRWLEIRPKPYIDVNRYTTENDVRNAFRLMTAALPNRKQPARPRRDPLVCLQCALWHDEFGWSHEQVADHFDWKLKRTDYAKPQSETVRLHINEGRRLRRQRKVAA